MSYVPACRTIRLPAFSGESAAVSSAELETEMVCSETDCLICSTFFRRMLIQTGDNPDRLKLDQRETAVMEFGRALAVSPFKVPDEVYRRVQAYFDPAQMVALTAFGALMVATNVVNNALEVDLDEYLQPYRKGVRESAAVVGKPA